MHNGQSTIVEKVPKGATLLIKEYDPNLIDYVTTAENTEAGNTLTVLQEATETINGDFGEGYWSDHWTYNLDLVNEYLSVFPEKEHCLLYSDSLTYFKSDVS